jgi:hypothetical protein
MLDVTIEHIVLSNLMLMLIVVTFETIFYHHLTFFKIS